jgi:hypothetical protein
MLEQYAKSPNSQISDYLLRKFPPELVEHGIDAAKLRAWYAANEEYLRGDEQRRITVDEELAERKLSNRKPGFLDWLLGGLDANPPDPAALRLAERYLSDGATRDPAGTAKWIRDNRRFLFFTDTGGYRWMVDLNAQRAAVEAAGGR